MKLLLALLLFSLSMISHAETLVNANIIDFSGQYASEQGSASAKTFKYDQIDFGASPKFELYKQADTFFLETPDETLQLDTIPKNINELETLNFSNIDFTSSASSFRLSIARLIGRSAKDSISLKNFIIRCSRIADGDLGVEILNACFNRSMGFRLKSGNINGNKYKSLELDVSNNKLKFEASISGITAKGSGKSHYFPEQNKIRFKVSKVMAGPINVTDKFWDELKKQRSQTFKVNPPYIHIYLD